SIRKCLIVSAYYSISSFKMQLALKLKTWGGKRAGAGRKRRAPRQMMPHRARSEHKKAHPVHVTLRIVHGIASLRRKEPFRLIKMAMPETNQRRSAFRLVPSSVQANHLPLTVEADHPRALSNAIRALEIRIAHRINRLSGRRGRLFADRYH